MELPPSWPSRGARTRRASIQNFSRPQPPPPAPPPFSCASKMSSSGTVEWRVNGKKSWRAGGWWETHRRGRDTTPCPLPPTHLPHQLPWNLSGQKYPFSFPALFPSCLAWIAGASATIVCGVIQWGQLPSGHPQPRCLTGRVQGDRPE